MSNEPKTCINCGTAVDTQATLNLGVTLFYCGSHTDGRITVACSIIRELKDKVRRLTRLAEAGWEIEPTEGNP